jgi:hypothetical protein
MLATVLVVVIWVQVKSAAVSNQQEEESRQQQRLRNREEREERRSSRERERERSRHRDRDGREREARGRSERERDRRKDRHRDKDRNKDRGHRDRQAERDRLYEAGSKHREERAGRREAAPDANHRHRDSRGAEGERPASAAQAQDAGSLGGEGRHRHVASSSSLLQQGAERGTKRRSMDRDDGVDSTRRSKEQRLSYGADREAARMDARLQIREGTEGAIFAPARADSAAGHEQSPGSSLADGSRRGGTSSPRRRPRSMDRAATDGVSPGNSMDDSGGAGRGAAMTGGGDRCVDDRMQDSEASPPGKPSHVDVGIKHAVRSRSRSNSLGPLGSPVSQGI